MVFLIVRKFPTRFETQMFITVLITARHLSLSLAKPIQSMSTYHPISLRSILIWSSHLCLGLPDSLLPQVSPPNPLNTTPHLTYHKHRHLLLYNVFDWLIFGEEYSQCSSTLCSLLQSPTPYYSQAEIYSSAPFTQIPSIYVLLSTWQTECHCIYIHNRHKYCLYILILLHLYIANRKILLVNSSFRQGADENCALVGYYVASSCNLLATFLVNLSFPSAWVKIPKINPVTIQLKS